MTPLTSSGELHVHRFSKRPGSRQCAHQDWLSTTTMLSRPGQVLRLRLAYVRSLHTTRPVRERFDPATVERAEDDVDVCIVGAGPAGLSAAIRLKQLEKEKGREVRVVVLEKGPEVGTSPDSDQALSSYTII
jgi:hypothetical protein